MITKPWGRAVVWLLFLSPFFFGTYGLATAVTARRSDVGSIVFDWEHFVPFIPWTIIPYWSIDVLYGLSLFVCASSQELNTHARRLLTAQVVAVSCFLLFPLTFTFPRPPVEGMAGFLFDALGKFDKPFNQAPSLHIALLVILWTLYARHVPAWSRWPVHIWFFLIGVSVLTTYQHHFLDLPTGAALGFFCLWLWPDREASPLARAAWTGDAKRRRIALCYAIGAILLSGLAWAFGGAALWLLWPAMSCVLVAANYAYLGPVGFQKQASGGTSLATRWLLAPYVAAARLNAWIWTRHDPAHVPVADHVFLGRQPRRATGFATIIDLCAELPGRPATGAWLSEPMLDLIPPPPDALRALAGTIEHAPGPLLICCALGYGRSAAVAAAWLVNSGRAADADAAFEMIRRVRPRAVLNAPVRAAITAS